MIEHLICRWRSGRRSLLRLIIPLIMFLLACVSASVTVSVVLIPYGGIIHEAEHRVWLTARGAFAALHNQIHNVIDHQNWRQAVTENTLIIALVAGVLLHAVLSYREIKEWVERLIDQMRARQKELRNEKKYHFLAKVAGITGAILITVQAYAIVTGGVAA